MAKACRTVFEDTGQDRRGKGVFQFPRGYNGKIPAVGGAQDTGFVLLIAVDEYKGATLRRIADSADGEFRFPLFHEHHFTGKVIMAVAGGIAFAVLQLGKVSACHAGSLPF